MKPVEVLPSPTPAAPASEVKVQNKPKPGPNGKHNQSPKLGGGRRRGAFERLHGQGTKRGPITYVFWRWLNQAGMPGVYSQAHVLDPAGGLLCGRTFDPAGIAGVRRTTKTAVVERLDPCPRCFDKLNAAPVANTGRAHREAMRLLGVKEQVPATEGK